MMEQCEKMSDKLPVVTGGESVGGMLVGRLPEEGRLPQTAPHSALISGLSSLSKKAWNVKTSLSPVFRLTGHGHLFFTSHCWLLMQVCPLTAFHVCMNINGFKCNLEI